MRTFRFEKLVRDRLVPDMQAEGCLVDWHGLKDEEYYHELLKKLEEEIAEARKHPSSEEVADVYEVGMAFEAYFGLFSEEHYQAIVDFKAFIDEQTGLDQEQIEAARQEKYAKLGGFNARMFVETVSLPESNPWVEYYERTYPEVK